MRRASVLLVLAALSLPSLARAQSPSQEDRSSFYEQGRKAMVAGNWNEAERIFASLWAQEKTYDVAVGLGQVELNLNKYRDAAEHLEFGIRKIAPREKAEVIERVKQGLAEAKKHVVTIKVSVDQRGADVTLDGNPVGTAPLEFDLFAAPGSHTIEASLPGFRSARQTVEGKEGESLAVELKLELPPISGVGSGLPSNSSNGSGTPPAVPSDGGGSTKSPSPVPAIVAASVGGVGLIGGVAFLVHASVTDSDRERRIEKLSGNNPCGAGSPNPAAECKEISDLADQAATSRTLTWVGFGVAAAGAVATVLLWPRSETKTATGLRVSPLLLPSANGLMAGASGAF